MTPKYIIVHHSVTPKDLPANQAEYSFNNTHKNRGFPVSSMGWHIGYHYVIYGSGELRQYRRDDEIGAHCKENNMNYQSIGICLAGNFDEEYPNSAQVGVLKLLMSEKTKQFMIPLQNIHPHRSFATYKSCYGRLLSDDWARNLLINEPMQTLIINYKGKFGLIVNYPLIGTILWAPDKERFRQLGQMYGRETVRADGSFAPADIVAN